MSRGMLDLPLPAVDDPEGRQIPAGLVPVIDAHVHLFPDPLFKAVRGWFEQYGWPIRYPLPAQEVARFLLRRGVERVVALHYAHRPGVARGLNRFMAEMCAAESRLIGLATVFPGEPGAATILEEGFDEGLVGVKLHAHVQCFEVDSVAMEEVYDCCAAHDRPLVMHVGREPRSPAYDCDTHALCDAGRLERVLRRHAGLRVCVPHLGADEFDAYRRLLQRYDNLWLDSTMALAGYLPGAQPPPLTDYRADRVVYGSDFPNIPYAWDRELRRIDAMGLEAGVLRRVLRDNAVELFGLDHTG